MTEEQFLAFDAFRNDFKNMTSVWSTAVPNLAALQKDAADEANTPSYSIETPVVYNTALDSVTKDDEIKIIVIGDNPGKNEQLLINRKYLVGQAGKIGEGFFRRNPELGIDFRRNAIILNKTPVHSAKTAQLKFIKKAGGTAAEKLLNETQLWMAEKTAEIAAVLGAEIWLVGYNDLKPKGLFSLYRDELKKYCSKLGILDRLLVFQHFSMNRFSIDLKDFMGKNCFNSLQEAVHALGTLHRDEIFGVQADMQNENLRKSIKK